MEKTHLIILVMVLALSLPFYAAASLKADKKSKVGVLGYSNLKLADVINLSPGDVSKITGKKMSLLNKISFIMMKHRMKKALKKNADLSVSEYYYQTQHKQIGTAGKFAIFFLGCLVIVFLVILILYSSSSFH
jgi:hypothetical protein